MATLEQVEKIRSNIFKDAWNSICDWQAFPWHLSRDGTPDSHLEHSSQAFCISVWGSMSGSVSRVLRTEIGELVESPVSDAFREAPQVEFEYSDRNLLNEHGGIPTTMDVLATWPDLVLVIESKLTESLGACSQPSRGFCTGTYGHGSDVKTGTSALCRLEVADGSRTRRLYWEVMKSLAKPDAFPEGVPCPFAGQAYQGRAS